MKHYIGTKLICAEPAWRVTAVDGDVYVVNKTTDCTMAACSAVEDGYRVRYPDGYESWSPKEVFEKAYLPLTVNEELRTSAPSISQKMVEDFVCAKEVTTMGCKTTVVRAVLRNGFEIVESSACVSPENYDVELGEKICMEKIHDKVWFLLGFLLQTAVRGVDGVEVLREFEEEQETCCCEDAPCECCEGRGVDEMFPMTFGEAIELMKRGHKVRRLGWNGKNQHIELAHGISYKNPLGEVVNAEHEAIGNMAVAFVGTSGVQMGWLASQADMLAEDWVPVVEESEGEQA